MTGVPQAFVNAFFSEIGPGGAEAGSGEIPEGKVALVHATIRAGRPDTDKAKIVSDLTHFIENTLDCPAEEVAVVTNDIPASWAMEDKAIDAKLAELEKKFGKKPDIIFILADDVCWGEMGWQGGGNVCENCPLVN